MGKQVAARLNLKTGYRCGDGEADFAGKKRSRISFKIEQARKC